MNSGIEGDKFNTSQGLPGQGTLESQYREAGAPYGETKEGLDRWAGEKDVRPVGGISPGVGGDGGDQKKESSNLGHREHPEGTRT